MVLLVCLYIYTSVIRAYTVPCLPCLQLFFHTVTSSCIDKLNTFLCATTRRSFPNFISLIKTWLDAACRESLVSDYLRVSAQYHPLTCRDYEALYYFTQLSTSTTRMDKLDEIKLTSRTQTWLGSDILNTTQSFTDLDITKIMSVFHT